MTTDELLLKIYYQIQDEMNLPDDIAVEVAQLRLKSNWTQEAEDDIIMGF